MKEPIASLVAGAIAVTAGGGASIAAEGRLGPAFVALAGTGFNGSHGRGRGGTLRDVLSAGVEGSGGGRRGGVITER
jgi:hypothetical protein